jgi:hypothetical protein
VNELPDSLVRFETELRQAIRRDRSRAKRRLATRVAALAVAAAAVALGVLSTLPGDGQSAVARAAAALRVDSGSILHFQMFGRQANPDGTVSTWRDERWQQTSSPYSMRQVEVGAEGARAEIATVDGRTQLYDAATNTIYTGASGPSKAELRKEKGGSSAEEAPNGNGVPKAEAKLSNGTDLKQRPAAPRRAGAGVQPDDADPFRAKLAALLAVGEARDEGHVTIDGRDAVKLVLGDGSSIYFVDASTYAPIEFRSTGEGGRTTLRFPVYEKLPATPANEALLSLQAQHPSATVDADPAHFEAAQARLFPRG